MPGTARGPVVVCEALPLEHFLIFCVFWLGCCSLLPGFEASALGQEPARQQRASSPGLR